MADNELTKIIKATIGDEKPAQEGGYKMPDKSGAIKIKNENDIKNFKALFFKKVNAQMGNGEIALYWLFGKGAGHQGGGAADLILDKKACEIKSYPTHDRMVLGKFKSHYTALELISYLFAFNNLFMKFGTSVKKNTSYKSLLTFNVNDLLHSIEYYNVLKIIFTSRDVKKAIEKVSKTTPQATKAFTDIGETCKKFTEQLKTLSIYNKTETENQRKQCAAAIAAYLLKLKLKEKPGNNGYMVNIRSTKMKKTAGGGATEQSTIDIHCHKVVLSDVACTYDVLAKSANPDGAKNKSKGEEKAGFSVGSGEIQINCASKIFK
jgi:hypothetical protein